MRVSHSDPARSVWVSTTDSEAADQPRRRVRQCQARQVRLVTKLAIPTAPGTSPHLVKTLGRWDIALLTIGSVIGSGIFLVPGQVAVATQMNPTLAASVWVVGAILSLCGAITYAELARLRPEAGGLYVYIRDGHGRVPAFVFGWISLFVNVAGTVAALAAAAAGILHSTLLASIPAGWLAAGITMGLGLVNLLPTRNGGDVQGWTAGLKFGAVALFALLLISRFAGGHHHDDVAATSTGAGRPDFVVALVAVLWAFEGWQYVTCAAGEVRDARRSVSFGLIVGVVALGLVFLLTSLAVTLWLDPTELANSRNVVESALRKAGFPALAVIVTIILPIAILSAAHATLLTGSRVVYAMASDGLLPVMFARVKARTGIPTLAVGFCTVIAAMLAALGSFDTLLAYVIVTSWLFYGLAGSAVFRIRPDGHILAIGVRIAAIAFCSGAVGVMLFGLVNGPPSARYGLAIAALGWVAAIIWFRKSGRADLRK
jgi:APA family basic amino acid/polyamine antiporter